MNFKFYTEKINVKQENTINPSIKSDFGRDIGRVTYSILNKKIEGLKSFYFILKKVKLSL